MMVVERNVGHERLLLVICCFYKIDNHIKSTAWIFVIYIDLQKDAIVHRLQMSFGGDRDYST